METALTLLRFWFGTSDDDAQVARTQSALWWNKDQDTDATIRARFAGLLAQAAEGELDGWLATPHGRLALIVLTDQFPRNMYRDTPEAFAFDHLARAWCEAGLALGEDQPLRPIERVFFYLPLEHSEALEDQQRAVALFEALSKEGTASLRPILASNLDFARRHRDIIARFGRYPHRNRILGRTSTREETEFLREKGSSF
ncbi:MAG: DUF924 domain-containing protein [Rhodocyclales bacterium]|nr:DUF924 domain-containing protein [Rhodocyclales bacterium]